MDIKISPYHTNLNTYKSVSFKHNTNNTENNANQNNKMTNRDKHMFTMGVLSTIGMIGVTYGIYDSVRPDYNKESRKELIETIQNTCDNDSIIKDFTGDSIQDILISGKNGENYIIDLYNSQLYPIKDNTDDLNVDDFEEPDSTNSYDNI